MLSKSRSTVQLGFYSTFEEQLSHSHPLYILANQIQWNIFEEAFASYIHKKDVMRNLSG
jgi:IS5 family transposase